MIVIHTESKDYQQKDFVLAENHLRTVVVSLILFFEQLQLHLLFLKYYYLLQMMKHIHVLHYNIHSLIYILFNDEQGFLQSIDTHYDAQSIDISLIAIFFMMHNQSNNLYKHNL